MSDDLRVEHQGSSPLRYYKPGDVQRLALVSDSVGEPHPHDTYFAETTAAAIGRSGRTLKRRVVVPGAAPGTVAFLDYTDYGDGYLYLHYMKTRRDYQRRGLARRLVEALLDSRPDARTLNFGKMMHQAVGKIHDAVAGRVRALGHRDY